MIKPAVNEFKKPIAMIDKVVKFGVVTKISYPRRNHSGVVRFHRYLSQKVLVVMISNVKARGGGGGGGWGVKIVFPVFTYLIRAAGEEQEEKNRT